MSSALVKVAFGAILFNFSSISNNTLSVAWLRLAGLTVGDPVLRTGNPLSVELGPGKYLFLRYEQRSSVCKTVLWRASRFGEAVYLANSFRIFLYK